MVMRQMRENTKWIMLATALAFVALMVFQWGMDLTGQSSAQYTGGEIGRVNGKPITYDEYYRVYRSLYDQQQQAASGPISSAVNKQIEDAAFDQVVMQNLILQELRRRDIVVSDDEVRNAARFAPPPEFMNNEMFMTDGQFDITKYHQFLASPAMDTQLLLDLEAYYREAIPRSKLYFQNTSGVYVSDNELWRMWRDTRDSASVRYIAFDPAQIVSDEAVSIAPAEVNAYYQAHKSEFLRPARASVKFVALDRAPTATDSTAALGRASAARARIAGGEKFEDVAKEISADSGSASQGGEITITRGQTFPAFDQAAFSLPVGALSEPVLTQAGYHLIRVESRSGEEAKVNHILVPIEMSVEQEDALLDKADSLDALAENMKLDAIAAQFGMQVRQAEMIPGLPFIAGIGQAEDVADWALHEGKPGEVSQVFDTPSAYVVAELVNRDEERTLTVEEADASIRAALKANKKLEKARETARQSLDRLTRGETMEAVASAYGTEAQDAGPFTRAEYVPGLGRLTPAIGAAFGLKPGETSGVVESERNLYIIRTTSRKDADRAAWEQQKKDQRQRVTQALAEQRWTQFVAALKANAKIVDDRAKVLTRAADQQPT